LKGVKVSFVKKFREGVKGKWKHGKKLSAVVFRDERKQVVIPGEISVEGGRLIPLVNINGVVGGAVLNLKKTKIHQLNN